VSTLATLRAQCRALLASTADWPDATLDKFIADAIRLYSTRFPRKWRHTITLATGTQTYALPGNHDILDVLSVEYPAGEDPPEFVHPVEPDSAAFADGEEVYARVAVADTVAIEADTVAGYIQFAEDVATGETAIVSGLEAGGRIVSLGAHLLREGQQQRLADVRELSAAFQALAHETQDHAEALDAFLEKRSPRFTGR